MLEIKQDLKDIKRAVFGNGDVGLAEQVRANNIVIKAHVEYCEKHKRRFNAKFSEFSSIIFKACVALALAYITYKIGIQ